MTDPEPIPFQPDRFRSAAAHYLQGRPAYAASLVADVARLCQLDGSGALLDLGCGPAQLARGFRGHVGSALGIDPEPEMLALAAELAAQDGTEIRLQQGSSQDLSAGMGPFRLVVIGRAFHWMDRAETLRRLDGLVVAGGAVALFHVEHADVPVNAWRAEFTAVLDKATGTAERRAWRAPGWVRHEAVLLDSAFSQLRRLGVIERRRVSGASLLARAFSFSGSTRARLGDRAEPLRRELERLLAQVAGPDGQIEEVVESVALLAHRS